MSEDNDVSQSHEFDPSDDVPYVPSWCYPNNHPPMCSCGHHDGYHNDKGQCLKKKECLCGGFEEWY